MQASPNFQDCVDGATKRRVPLRYFAGACIPIREENLDKRDEAFFCFWMSGMMWRVVGHAHLELVGGNIPNPTL